MVEGLILSVIAIFLGLLSWFFRDSYTRLHEKDKDILAYAKKLSADLIIIRKDLSELKLEMVKGFDSNKSQIALHDKDLKHIEENIHKLYNDYNSHSKKMDAQIAKHSTVIRTLIKDRLEQIKKEKGK